jgi:hypothetical protein
VLLLGAQHRTHLYQYATPFLPIDLLRTNSIVDYVCANWKLIAALMYALTNTYTQDDEKVQGLVTDVYVNCR